MRFHVVSLPHTQTTEAYSACAFTEKVRKFCIMMKSLGHTVYLYAGEQNEAPCDELITCVTEIERLAHVGANHFVQASFDYGLPFWRKFNHNAAAAIALRAQPQDFVCLIGGLAHKQIADELPNMMSVEFGIGYGGTFAKFRVWESYAWMHTVYGAQTGGNANAADGQWFDAVIPSYIEPEKFPYRGRHRRGNDYYLFIGRLTDRKGHAIARQVCEKLGKRLLIAGQGDNTGYGEYAGVVGPKERGLLMAGAIAVFAPTIYVEPFGTVVIEAQACGTPTITTDWGAFTETNIHGVTGFRCRTFAEFCDAAEKAKTLDHRVIRRHAIKNYSLPVIAKTYEAYFERLRTIQIGDGWYEPAKSTSGGFQKDCPRVA